MKIAVITCYKQPDYVRVKTLFNALASNSNNSVIHIKNKRPGLLRYPEVLIKLMLVRLKGRPDVYLLTFRGYEVLPAVSVLTWPKALIFDEFINPLEWLDEPRPELWVKFVPRKLLKQIYRLMLQRTKYILADTDIHAIHSAKLTLGRVDPRYVAIAVSTDEKTFFPAKTSRQTNVPFVVFYYGNMLPLHGLKYVLAAAIELKNEAVVFKLVGGTVRTKQLIDQAREKGANIEYSSWVPFDKLPEEIKNSDLCLGGPFGKTEQASRVITGKSYQFLASGAPTIIGSNLATKLFVDKENCILVPLGSSKSLVEAIRWAMNHHTQLANIGTNGRSLYEKHFSNKIIARQLNELLDRL